MKEKPLVTVLMPVYNGEEYLDTSIKSILDQTYSNLEFVIVDNASTDNSLKIIKKFKKIDKRIRLYKQTKNKGLVSSLNLGLEIAVGEYVARMDCDDIAYPNRIKEQINFMKNREDLIVTSIWAKKIGNQSGEIITVTKPNEIKQFLMFGNPIIHSGVLINLVKFKKNNFKYRQNCPLEDYELWNRIVEKGNIEVIPKVLMEYRFRDNSMSYASTNYIRGLLRVTQKDALIINIPILLKLLDKFKSLLELHSRFSCKERMNLKEYIILPFWLLLICLLSLKISVFKVVINRVIAYCYSGIKGNLLNNPKICYKNYNDISHLSL